MFICLRIGINVANDSFVKRICAISPHVEMLVRRVYWSNVKWLSKRGKKNIVKIEQKEINFEEIEQFLIENGVIKGSLIVVHSTYAPFESRGKNPNQLLDMLLGIVGENGTLAMPATPKFKNAISVENYLTEKKQ